MSAGGLLIRNGELFSIRNGELLSIRIGELLSIRVSELLSIKKRRAAFMSACLWGK